MNHQEIIDYVTIKMELWMIKGEIVNDEKKINLGDCQNNIMSNQEPKSEHSTALENKLSIATNFCN